MKIVFSPLQQASNKYVDIMVEALNLNGVECFPLSYIFKSYKNFNSIDIIHLNWFEQINNNKGFILRIFRLFIIYIGRIPIYWTMHNRIPHDSKNVKKQKLLIWILTKISKRIIIHSELTREILRTHYKISDSKICYVPHPNYIDSYPLHKMNDSLFKNDKLKLLFIGMVRPYKNIELLIRLMHDYQDEVSLTIAGQPLSKDYELKIKNLKGENDSIFLDLEFIEDKKMISYIENSDLVILPYNKESSLNSGTVLLAFSYSRSVICPKIGTILDFSNGSKILSYDYVQAKDHLKVLKNQVERAIMLKKNDENIFETWGKEMNKIVSRDNNPSKISGILKDIYSQ